MSVTRHTRSPDLEEFGYSGGDLVPREDGVSVIGTENKRFKELRVVGGSIFIGGVELEDEEGCLATDEFHAHGRDGVSGYLKVCQGTTPSAHSEADHIMIWADSADKLRLEMPDGADYTVVAADENLLTILPGDLVIDVDDAEALLIRKEGDTGDVFVVDTINNKVVIGTGAPGIRMVKLTGTSPAVGASGTIAHGLDKTKIISATVLVANDTGNQIPPNFTSVNNHEFDFFIDTTNVHVYCKAANSSNIDGNAVTILIIYEE